MLYVPLYNPIKLYMAVYPPVLIALFSAHGRPRCLQATEYYRPHALASQYRASEGLGFKVEGVGLGCRDRGQMKIMGVPVGAIDPGPRSIVLGHLSSACSCKSDFL